jgi:hypothetical protein
VFRRFSVSAFSSPESILAFRIFAFSLFVFVLTPLAFAEAPPPTEYEWEVQSPNRTLFRDRTPVGQVFLMTEARKGLFSRKPKESGEALNFFTEVAFVPGDTVRTYGAVLSLGDGPSVTASTLFDGAELASLWKYLDYAAATAKNIAAVQRTGTRIEYHSKSGLALAFSQTGTVQRFEVRFPAATGRSEIIRPLTGEQLSTLRDLVDLAIYDLKRQGATLTSPVSQKP